MQTEIGGDGSVRTSVHPKLGHDGGGSIHCGVLSPQEDHRASRRLFDNSNNMDHIHCLHSPHGDRSQRPRTQRHQRLFPDLLDVGIDRDVLRGDIRAFQMRPACNPGRPVHCGDFETVPERNTWK